MNYKKFILGNFPEIKKCNSDGELRIHLTNLLESYDDGTYCMSCGVSFITNPEKNDSEKCSECYDNDPDMDDGVDSLSR